jgi:hypothetical protein
MVFNSALRANQFMSELMTKEYEQHLALAPTFNSFLFTERAATINIRHLKIKLGSFSNRVAGLQKNVDQVAVKQGSKATQGHLEPI